MERTANRLLKENKNQIIQFDSCTAMFHSSSNFLEGKEFKGVDITENIPAPFNLKWQ